MNLRLMTRLVALVVLLGGCAGQNGEKFSLQNVDVGALVSNIKGLREVGEPEEISVGRGVAETLLGARPLQPDPELQRYVNAVGLWVARQSERPGLPWHFGVSDSDQVNAFATPGGNVIITLGMLRILRNEAELAGVIGHEVGHVVRKHHLNALRKEAFLGMLGQGVTAASQGRRSEKLVQALAGPTKELYARGLDKDDEFEADRVGVVLAARAGYDPWGLPSALQTLAGIKPDSTYLALLLKTHPAPSARLEKLAAAMTDHFDGYTDAPQQAQRFHRMTAGVRQ